METNLEQSLYLETLRSIERIKKTTGQKILLLLLEIIYVPW